MDAEARKLIIAVIQASDSDLLTETLEEHKVLFTRLPSVGSFLSERNATYLVSCKAQDEDSVRELLITTCQKRIALSPPQSKTLRCQCPTPPRPWLVESISFHWTLSTLRSCDHETDYRDYP